MEINFDIEYIAAEGLSVVVESRTLGIVPLQTADRRRWTGAAEWLSGESVEYRYAVVRGAEPVRTEQVWRRVAIESGVTVCRMHDVWRDEGAQDILEQRTEFTGAAYGVTGDMPAAECRRARVTLRACVPYLPAQSRMIVTGDAAAAGEWQPSRGVSMQRCGVFEWCATMPTATLCGEYKFVIENACGEYEWEHGVNRVATASQLSSGEAEVVDVGVARFGFAAWRGAGVAVPLFSLRSSRSWGVGDAADLRRMVDWAKMCGMQMLQLLPVNDTTMRGDWRDSYPYNACSSFALHPMYVAVSELPQLRDKTRQRDFEQRAEQLNALPQVDYEQVNALKSEFLHSLFAERPLTAAEQRELRDFVEQNGEWLKAYAVYCYLRDEVFRCADIRQWHGRERYEESFWNEFNTRDEVHYVCRVQWLLYSQLRAAKQYAAAAGVMLKGDIPIGVSPQSADVWQHGELFNLSQQAGAPPDAFATEGQNWGFPTYNWARMAEDGYAWWRMRLRQMAELFDAYRIDHILGFFRIWEIPLTSVRGLLGHFAPALPLSEEEMREGGFEWCDRYAEPYITKEVLREVFGEDAQLVENCYVRRTSGGELRLRAECATQRLVAEMFAADTSAHGARLREGLMRLCEEVLFVRDVEQSDMYHPRIGAQRTAVYASLSAEQRQAFDVLYDDFFYRRHNDFWRAKAMRRLPELLSSTGMLACGEDLGMIPDCVAPVMRELGILSLEIERMPKQFGARFGATTTYPYLSVAATSTHDMTPLREWWEQMSVEERAAYWHEILGGDGDAPSTCSGRTAAMIVERHVASPSMLAVLPVQDWLAVSERLRLPDADGERINVPSESAHYWRYRMHIALEELCADEVFANTLRQMLHSGGRT